MVAALLVGAAISVFGQGRALARLSVVSMRATGAHSAEQVSQALMGTPMEVLQKGSDWSRVRTPDGYEGWIINHSLVFLTDKQFREWQQSPRVVVTAPYEFHDKDRRTDLVAGDVLQVVGDSLRLPDGRMILSPGPDVVAPLGSFGEFRPELLPRTAEMYMGVPYVWGGMSSKGMDCSGLVRMAYAAQGRWLPRDAKDQARWGREVPADSLQAGDLLFIGNKKTGRVTHVAIYDRDGEYIHASQLVRRNSLDPSSPLYLPYTILSRRRIPGKPMNY